MRLFLLASLILALGICLLGGMSIALVGVVYNSGGDLCVNSEPAPALAPKTVSAPATAPNGGVGAKSQPAGFAFVVREESGAKIVIRLTGEVETAQSLAIGKALEALQRNRRHMLFSGLSLNVRDDQEYFGHRGDWRIIGHFCSPADLKVCLLRKDISEVLIWHELWHVYEDRVTRQGDKTHEEWDRIAGPVYRNNPATEGDPRDGLVTNYARFNGKEDRAVFFQASMEYLHGLRTKSALTYHGGLKTDKRYRQKLSLMKEKYKVFTDDEYRTIKLLFE